MQPDETRAQLDRWQNDYPFPAGEFQRLKARRWILNHIPKGTIGAEIGVFRGHFSEVICEVATPKKLYLIDPWTTLGEHFGWGKQYTAFNALPTAVARDEAKLRTDLYPATETVIIEGAFPACGDQIRDKLDWVYLDASHKFEPTLRELRQIQAYLKPGGVILGDDWNANPYHSHYGVTRACHVFARESSFEVVAAGPAAQWCMRDIEAAKDLGLYEPPQPA